MQFPVEGATFQDGRPTRPEDRAEALPDGGPFRCASSQGAVLGGKRAVTEVGSTGGAAERRETAPNPADPMARTIAASATTARLQPMLVVKMQDAIVAQN
jgi:hypothetical protein